MCGHTVNVQVCTIIKQLIGQGAIKKMLLAVVRLLCHRLSMSLYIFWPGVYSPFALIGCTYVPVLISQGHATGICIHASALPY